MQSDADVSQCVKFASKHNLDVAIRGGGHSYHGASSTEGMVIDLRKLNRVTVDKSAKRVTGGGGCIAMDLEKAAEAEGLGVLFGAVNETGEMLLNPETGYALYGEQEESCRGSYGLVQVSVD